MSPSILPDSARVLDEITTLLQQDAALTLRVEGHTDNQTAASNQTLTASARRGSRLRGSVKPSPSRTTRLTRTREEPPRGVGEAVAANESPTAQVRRHRC
jgi:outer membrane protein OmpA-like peptidoglycan-associated protein